MVMVIKVGVFMKSQILKYLLPMNYIDQDMGIIPKTILNMTDRLRGELSI